MIKTYFHDFHTLPLDVPRLLCTLGHAHGKGNLDGVCNEHLGNGQYGMIGSGKAMRNLYQHIAKSAMQMPPFESTVKAERVKSWLLNTPALDAKDRTFRCG